MRLNTAATPNLCSNQLGLDKHASRSIKSFFLNRNLLYKFKHENVWMWPWELRVDYFHFLVYLFCGVMFILAKLSRAQTKRGCRIRMPPIFMLNLGKFVGVGVGLGRGVEWGLLVGFGRPFLSQSFRIEEKSSCFPLQRSIIWFAQGNTSRIRL